MFMCISECHLCLWVFIGMYGCLWEFMGIYECLFMRGVLWGFMGYRCL